MLETSRVPLPELIQYIMEDDWLMPVSTMEAILAHGAGAVAPLIDAIETAHDDPDADPELLWATVLLGELRRPDAVSVLTEVLRRAVGKETSLSVAAAESLAKIGPPAVPALAAVLQTGEPPLRHWAYAAASGIADEAAHALLLGALQTDPEMAAVVATALADHGRTTDIPAIYDALQRCEPWQRMDLQDAILQLHRAEPLDHPRTMDWRLRYRLDPVLGAFQLSWPHIAFLMHGEDMYRQRKTPPLRPLQAILDEPETPRPRATCECCGVPNWEGTGVRVCARTALPIAVMQSQFLDRLCDAEDTDDLFELMDALDEDLWALEQEPKPRKKAAREKREDRKSVLQIQRGACVWAVRRGLRKAGRARAALDAEALRLAQLHGDPDGLLAPVEQPSRAPASVGRNDPCPCGSGRKYKKCCATRSPAAAAGAVRAMPTLVTADGEALSFARAHYVIRDAAAVRRALEQCAELEPDPMGSSFVWTRARGGDERGVLGTILLEGDALVLECLSDDRLQRGKRLIEEIAGASVSHRVDTSQDPWQAVADKSRRPHPQRDAVPTDEEIEVGLEVLDRHYRSWPDEPLPALAGRTARECARDPAGRRRVAELLRSIEAMDAVKPAHQRYDFGWLWAELGITRSL